MRLAGMYSAGTLTPKYILSSRYWLKMIGVDAVADTTQMVQVQTIGDRTPCQLIEIPMRSLR